MNSNTCLWVEGMGPSCSPTPCLMKRLPTDVDVVSFLHDWPSYIIQLPLMSHSQAKYYLQYNIKDNRVVKLMSYPSSQSNMVDSMAQAFKTSGAVVQNYTRMISSGDIIKLYQAQKAADDIFAKYNL